MPEGHQFLPEQTVMTKSTSSGLIRLYYQELHRTIRQ